MRSKHNCITAANKGQIQREGALDVFIFKFLASLRRQQARPSGIFPYPTVFRLLSALFSLNKRESWLFLRELQEMGAIKLIPAHGVRIVVEVDGDGYKKGGGNRKKGR